MKTNAWKRNKSGFTLLEVLIGIVIFALGMLALAQLQTSLARNSTDANARTVATNIAEEMIEDARKFSQITSETGKSAYNDIVTAADLPDVTRGGNVFRVETSVVDYYYEDGAFTPDPTLGAARSDMKLLEVTVSWVPEGEQQEFYIDGDSQTEGALGSGSITLRDVISSITSPSSGKVALGTAGDNSYAPPVDYNPGQNPDIVSIQLGDNKFKESTTPLPDVVRSGELVETRFDVVTYSQDDAGATFLRREEFRAVSCECTLRAWTTGTQGGLRPTLWEGAEYTEGEFVAKPYGVSASNQQSVFCDVCCRDHHDGGLGSNDEVGDPGRSLYNPFRSGDDYHGDGVFAGNHKHYNRNQNGVLVLAENDGDRYVEACRMVRKDGFFRVAQDLRQEGLNAFPADFLDDENEIDVYSQYVTDAVEQYQTEMGDGYELGPPSLTLPANMIPAVVFPASTEDLASLMSDPGVTSQQLRSRGIYLDYMSDALRTRISCLDDPDADCDVPGVTSALEIIPFYDVQLTWLARWNESPINEPIDVSNEAVADDNSHSRGFAVLGDGLALTRISSTVHPGNLGLTATDPIDPRYGSDLESYILFAQAIDFTEPPPLTNTVITGIISSSVPGVKAADVEIEATGAQCDRTNTGFRCVLEVGATTPRLKIFNYYKPNAALLGCSVNGNLSIHGAEVSTNSWTRFNLPLYAISNADIVIRQNSCN